MAIQVRKGADADFDANKMLPGELAMTTDGTRKVYAAFGPGDVANLNLAPLIDEENLQKSGFETVGSAIMALSSDISGMKKIAVRQTTNPVAPARQDSYLKLTRIGNSVFLSNTLTTTVSTGAVHSYPNAIPVGYRPNDIARTTTSLWSSGNFVGTARIAYGQSGQTTILTSYGSQAEYHHSYMWITEDDFPEEDVVSAESEETVE